MTISSTSLSDMMGEVTLTKEQFEGDLFNLTVSTYALYESALTFIDYAEENKDKVLMKKSQWMAFMKDFYDNYNGIRNKLRDFMKGEEPNFEEVNKSFIWIHKSLKVIFQRELSKKPYVYDSIMSGKIYVTFFYHVKSLEVYVSNKLNIPSEIEENKKIIEMSNNEHRVIEKLEVLVKNNINSLHKIDRDTQIQLLGLWERTLDFIYVYLENMKVQLNNLS